jgi:hypothetical protein
MKTGDFNSALTSEVLNEQMYKTFGARVNFEKYDRAQLENYRNVLRTDIHQMENTSGFNELLANESYQKNKHLLELLNTRIKEMLGEAAKKKMVNEKAKSKKQQQAAGVALAAKRAGKKPAGKGAAAKMSKMGTKELEKFASTKHKGLPLRKKKKKKVSESDFFTNESKKSKLKNPTKNAKPDYLDFDKDGDKTEPMKKALADKKKKKGFPPAKKSKKKSKLRETYDYPLADQEMADTVDRAIREKTARNFEYNGKSYKFLPLQQVVRPSRRPDEGDEATAEKLTQAYKRIYASTRGLADPQLRESQLRNNFKIILEGIRYYIAEDEEGKAMDITAGADMVKDFTSWMQRLGQYQTKSTIELADSIRSNFGPQEAEQFKATVTPAIQSSLEALTASREIITKAVSVLAGEEQPDEMMGQPGEEDEGMPSFEPNDDSMNVPPEEGEEAEEETGEEETGEEDQFGASDAASAGRELRESRRQRQLRKLHEANSIMRRLAG